MGEVAELGTSVMVRDTARRLEYLIPALAIMSLLAACLIISQKKLFGNDELLSYYLLSDESFNHMLKAFHDKINNSPPLYFLLGWAWASAFGSTPLSLRLFSSVGISIAVVITWITLRRVFGFRSASIGTLTVFCTSSLIAEQNAEARMYGLYLALSSLLILQFQVNNATKHINNGLLASNTGIHAALVQTHLFGLLYSGIFLLAQIVTDRDRGIFRTKLYAAIVVSWLPLLLYLPSLLNQADAGFPRFWLQSPTLSDFFNLLFVTAPSGRVVAILGCLGLYLAAVFRPRHVAGLMDRSEPHLNAECSLAIIGIAFLAVPIVVFVISLIKPMFLDRYLIPTALIWSILIAAIARTMGITNSGAEPRSLLERGIGVVRTSAITLILAGCVLYPLLHAQRLSPPEQLPGSSDTRYGYENLPIAVQFSHDFVTRLYYSSKPERYFFILDWPSAVEDSSGRFPPEEFKHMDALKRQYPKTFNHVVQSDKFLETNSRFLVLTMETDYDQKCPRKSGYNFDCPRWVADRLSADPRYRIQSLGDIDGPRGKQVLLLVEKTAK